MVRACVCVCVWVILFDNIQNWKRYWPFIWWLPIGCNRIGIECTVSMESDNIVDVNVINSHNSNTISMHAYIHLSNQSNERKKKSLPVKWIDFNVPQCFLSVFYLKWLKWSAVELHENYACYICCLRKTPKRWESTFHSMKREHIRQTMWQKCVCV